MTWAQLVEHAARVSDCEVGTQEPPQTTLCVLNIARPRDQLLQKVVKLQAGRMDKAKIWWSITARVRHRATTSALGNRLHRAESFTRRAGRAGRYNRPFGQTVANA